MAQLYVISGPDIGKSFDVREGIVVGRGDECEVQVRGRSVSRCHARIERDGEWWHAVDLDSSNGVFVDDRRVSRGALADGCTLRLGDVEIRFRDKLGAPDAAPVSSSPAVEEDVKVPAPLEVENDDEHEDDDEISLEGEWGEGGTTAVQSPETQKPEPAARPPARPSPEPAPRRAAPQGAAPGAPARQHAVAPGNARGAAKSEALQAGRDFLQYSRVENKTGLFGGDLSQFPAWVRSLVFVLALAVLGTVVYGVYRLTMATRSEPVEEASGEAETDFESWAQEE